MGKPSKYPQDPSPSSAPAVAGELEVSVDDLWEVINALIT
jgi:biotin operon repressor